jgi:RNA polymerase sigma-70 factor, ECF subfamily
MDQTLLSELAPLAPETYKHTTEDFDALARVHWPRIFRFILASVRDLESAQNLTQDCFVRAYRSRDQFRGASTIGTWLMQIAINLVRNHEGSSRLKFWRRAFRSSVDVADIRDWIPDQQISPEAAAVAKEQVAAIWRVVASLSHRQRMVFLLRFVEDMDLLEIAAATGLKEGTVKVHLFRALQAVRAAIGGKK